MSGHEGLWKTLFATTTVAFIFSLQQIPVNGYFEESHEETYETRNYLPCGSLIYLEVDQKYYIRTEGYGSNKAYQHDRYLRSGFTKADNSSIKKPPRGKTNRQSNCLWRFESNGKCRLMAHFDHYYPGDRRCSSQYIFLTDDYTEIQACSTRGLPRAFEATSNRIKIKHYRKSNIHLSEFEGYVICHSHGTEYADEFAEEYTENEYTSHHANNRHRAYVYPEGTYDDTYDEESYSQPEPSHYKSQHHSSPRLHGGGGSYAATYGSHSSYNRYPSLQRQGSSNYHASNPPVAVGHISEASVYPNKYSQPLPLTAAYVQQPARLVPTSNAGTATQQEYHGRDSDHNHQDSETFADTLTEPVSVLDADSLFGRSFTSEHSEDVDAFADQNRLRIKQ